MFVLLDTNFLMAVFQLKLDVFTELARIMDTPYELAIVDKTLMELDRLAAGRKKEALPAKMARKLIAERNIQILPTEDGHTDDLIARLCNENGWYVATSDKGLKDKVKKVVFIRQKTHLDKKG